jgi:hypothetical protein
MSAAALRPLGFFLLMIGFGLRLDTVWQGLAWLLLVAGAACAAAAFVPPRAGR